MPDTRPARLAALERLLRDFPKVIRETALLAQREGMMCTVVSWNPSLVLRIEIDGEASPEIDTQLRLLGFIHTRASKDEYRNKRQWRWANAGIIYR
jgi:hypothetical protein